MPLHPLHPQQSKKVREVLIVIYGAMVNIDRNRVKELSPFIHTDESQGIGHEV